MTVATQELAPFQPLIDELAQAREHTDQYGQYRGNRESIEGRQNSINYELAKQAESAVVAKVVHEINGTDDTVLDPFQRAISVKVLAHTWRTPVNESMELIQEGFDVFERVREGAEQNRGIVAILAKSSIALYSSRGADDLHAEPISWERGHHEIVYRLPDGFSVAVPDVKDKSFPDTQVKPSSFSQVGMPGGHGNHVAELLSVLDPSSPRNQLPFIRLGTPEQPLNSLDDHLKSDAQRFAGRLLVKTLAKADWIQITPPSEAVKAKVIDQVSDIYQDLLVGDVPRDAAPHLVTRHFRMTGLDVSTRKDRNKSLGTYNRSARDGLYYAADISAADVEAATREKIAKLEESTRPDRILKAFRAKQFMDPFFAKLVEA
jgi:hypothetical protein